jgi:hypothetical protein
MDSDGVCIANIGPRERRRRLAIGIGGIAVGAAATAALVVGGAATVWRATVFLPLLLGAIGFFQWRERT